jgi:hypothetical protein
MQSFFDTVNAHLNDESNMHKRFLTFKNQTNEILNTANDLPDSAKHAAQMMIRQLEELLKADATNPYSKSQSNQSELKENAQRIIARYETDLEVYPGFWNRFKNLINTFFQSLGIDNLFDVEKTTFGFDNSEYQKIKCTSLGSN